MADHYYSDQDYSGVIGPKTASPKISVPVLRKIAETEKAFLFEVVGGQEQWFPKKHVYHYDEGKGEILITGWLYLQKKDVLVTSVL